MLDMKVIMANFFYKKRPYKSNNIYINHTIYYLLQLPVKKKPSKKTPVGAFSASVTPFNGIFLFTVLKFIVGC